MDKYLLSLKKRKGIRVRQIQIKWTVSRGRETEGYSICSLYINNVKTTSCKGYGYDMKGTVLGNYIGQQWCEEIQKLPIANFSCLNVNGKAKKYIDGGYGWNSVTALMEKLGVKISKISVTKKQSIWILEPILKRGYCYEKN